MTDSTRQLIEQLLAGLEVHAKQAQLEATARKVAQAEIDSRLPWAFRLTGMLQQDAIAQGLVSSDGSTARAWQGNGFSGPPTVKQFDVWTRECWDCGQELVLLVGPADRNPTRATGSRRCHGCQAAATRSNWAKAKRKQRAVLAPDPTTICQQCGATFHRKRSTARFCSTRCRVAAHRAEGV